MYQLELYFSLLLIISKCCLAASASDKADSDCKTSGIPGKCKLLPNCPLAFEEFKKTQSHSVKRCGFDGFTEIVCCPIVTAKKPISDISTDLEDDDEDLIDDLDTVQQNRFPKRKCEQACEEISKEVKSKINFNILGGMNASVAEYPHMAALGYDTGNEDGIQWSCSASVISNRYLLTAAHCIENQLGMPKKCRLGITMLNEKGPQDYNISNITTHKNYDPISKHNDIALIKVNQEIQFSDKVYPACLYFENNDPLDLIVTGWGKTTIGNEDDRSNILQKATLMPIPIRDCNISYVTRSSGSITIANSQICARSNISDACLGDSGGPLQIRNEGGSYSIVGIISFGAGCGGKVPGVYTRVEKFLDWIERIVWP